MAPRQPQSSPAICSACTTRGAHLELGFQGSALPAHHDTVLLASSIPPNSGRSRRLASSRPTLHILLNLLRPVKRQSSSNFLSTDLRRNKAHAKPQITDHWLGS